MFQLQTNFFPPQVLSLVTHKVQTRAAFRIEKVMKEYKEPYISTIQIHRIKIQHDVDALFGFELYINEFTLLDAVKHLSHNSL